MAVNLVWDFPLVYFYLAVPPVGNATLVVANVLTCNLYPPHMAFDSRFRGATNSFQLCIKVAANVCCDLRLLPVMPGSVSLGSWPFGDWRSHVTEARL